MRGQRRRSRESFQNFQKNIYDIVVFSHIFFEKFCLWRSLFHRNFGEGHFADIFVKFILRKKCIRISSPKRCTRTPLPSQKMENGNEVEKQCLQLCYEEYINVDIFDWMIMNKKFENIILMHFKRYENSQIILYSECHGLLYARKVKSIYVIQVHQGYN